MPTTQPRYQITDTGRTRELLDRAARRWPHLAGDRKLLLLRLAEAGEEHLGGADAEHQDADLARQLRASAGRWVAIRDGAILVVADDAGAVITALRDRGQQADSVYRVPMTAGDAVGEHGLV